MKIDKGLINHWANLFESEDAKNSNDPETNESSKSPREINRLNKIRQKLKSNPYDDFDEFHRASSRIRQQEKELDSAKDQDKYERQTQNIRKSQSEWVGKLKKVVDAASKHKIVMLGGGFGNYFRAFVNAPWGYEGDDDHFFTLDQAAKVLGLDRTCVYISSDESTWSKNSSVFILYFKDGEWKWNEIDEIDFEYEKTEGYGYFDHLANKIEKFMR